MEYGSDRLDMSTTNSGVIHKTHWGGWGCVVQNTEGALLNPTVQWNTSVCFHVANADAVGSSASFISRNCFRDDDDELSPSPLTLSISLSLYAQIRFSF